jgi:phosphopantetheinyl transferase
MQIGIDMEEVRKYDPLVAKKLFTSNERELVVDNDYLFTKTFVMKEAYGKYMGTGLGEYLSEIEVNEIDNIKVIDIDNLIIAIIPSNSSEIKGL